MQPVELCICEVKGERKAKTFSWRHRGGCFMSLLGNHLYKVVEVLTNSFQRLTT